MAAHRRAMVVSTARGGIPIDKKWQTGRDSKGLRKRKLGAEAPPNRRGWWSQISDEIHASAKSCPPSTPGLEPCLGPSGCPVSHVALPMLPRLV